MTGPELLAQWGPWAAPLLLALAAFGAGVLNAMAGGGSFLTFPALVFTGVPPIAANATSAVAVSPGYLGSVLGFRPELAALDRRLLRREAVVSALGGLCGAGLLLVTPAKVFAGLVPWLLLFATVLFALGPSLVRFMAQRPGKVSQQGEPRGAGANGAVQSHPGQTGDAGSGGLGGSGGEGGASSSGSLAAWRMPGLLLVSVYGGYFNGGLGILLMALYTLVGEARIHTANALKNFNSLVLSLLSVVAFALAGAIVWPQALLMMACATVGGFVGARLARRMPASAVRALVIGTGLLMSAVFFARGG